MSLTSQRRSTRERSSEAVTYRPRKSKLRSPIHVIGGNAPNLIAMSKTSRSNKCAPPSHRKYATKMPKDL